MGSVDDVIFVVDCRRVIIGVGGDWTVCGDVTKWVNVAMPLDEASTEAVVGVPELSHLDDPGGDCDVIGTPGLEVSSVDLCV